MRKTKIITIASQKGGVAKTTTSINVGSGLAQEGKKVLLIDIDSQYHLSKWLGYEPDGKPTISDLIYNEVANLKLVPYESYIRHSDTEQLDYIPANSMLSGIIAIIGTDSDSSSVIQRVLNNDFFNQYDYIIIDCPPSLDLLVTNALKVCDTLLVPIQADMLSYESINQMLITLQRVKPNVSLKTDVKLLVTMYQKQTLVSRSIDKAVRESYSNMALDTRISFRTEAKQSCILNKSSMHSKSVIGDEYRQVVKEIMEVENNG